MNVNTIKLIIFMSIYAISCIACYFIIRMIYNNSEIKRKIGVLADHPGFDDVIIVFVPLLNTVICTVIPLELFVLHIINSSIITDSSGYYKFFRLKDDIKKK